MTSTPTDQCILLQDFVPYDESVKWDIHNNYFQQRGNKAWLTVEVPYYVTSNTAAALQNAEVVHAAVTRMEEESKLPRGSPIPILELASGVGLFAINFLTMLAKLDADYGTNYRKRVQYHFTDYSRTNLLDAAGNPTLQRLQEEGAIHFFLVNALAPEEVHPLDDMSFSSPRFVAVIANYLHCCLPLTILRKKGGAIYEKQVRISLNVDPAIGDKETYCREIVEHPVGKRILENLIEEESFSSRARFRDVLHREVIEEAAQDFDTATIVYPYGSFQSLARTFPLLLDGGVIIISDKGYADRDYMRGERECAPSIHGNSFAHSLNVPLLELFVKKLGYSAERTSNPDYSLQTILIEKRETPALQDVFRTQFIETNRNLTASDFYQAARKFQSEGNHEMASRFYLRTLELRPADAASLYHLAECQGELSRHEEALSSCREGKDCDYFSEYDFSFRSGLALHNLGCYEGAIAHYSASLIEEGGHEVTHYNIARCHENLGHLPEAAESYERSCRKNPAYEKALRALQALKARL